MDNRDPRRLGYNRPPFPYRSPEAYLYGQTRGFRGRFGAREGIGIFLKVAFFGTITYFVGKKIAHHCMSGEKEAVQKNGSV
ncbi:hypothetical protein K4F52_009910 [Lecanicillium sp. MT-2017a]|nr:hypothetical protein K4F52_009910 [Lecanicillium sp. MT-2017a]